MGFPPSFGNGKGDLWDTTIPVGSLQPVPKFISIFIEYFYILYSIFLYSIYFYISIFYLFPFPFQGKGNLDYSRDCSWGRRNPGSEERGKEPGGSRGRAAGGIC